MSNKDMQAAAAEARTRGKPKWLKEPLKGEAAFKKLPGGSAPGWMNGKADGDPGLPLGLDAIPAPAKEKPAKKRRVSRKRAK